jgi:sugar phosphate isomerase/epimerase
MKLCFNAGPNPLEEYFSFADENGFPWMELSCNNPGNFLDKFNQERINRIKKLKDQRVFDAIPSKYFGLTLDVAHASLLPGGSKSFMDAFPDKIISTHISDNDLYLDRHLPVGEGKIDFKPVFEQLISLQFDGTLNIELKENADRLLSKQRLEVILKDLVDGS